MTCANHPERERVAFCQNCGKALCQECARTVGTAVFCEPCLAARIAGSPSTGPAASGPYPPPPPGIPIPPSPTGEPNPGLAALLGFIPGVGAMYNGQFAKGIVHLIVFAILVSLAHDNGIFGLFVFGWIVYQVFEAYQTARARRDGTPLPNPFGLNDLGERLGFGKSWPATAPPPPSEAVPPATPYTSAAPFTPPAPAYQPPPTSTAWESYAPPAATHTAWDYQAATNPYLNTPAFDPNLPAPRNRFPAGAIWLIGLGAIFLIGNTGIFHGFPMHQIIPIFLIGLGLWLFYYKMTATGATLADDGTPLYRMRLFSALRGSIWVILVGVMFLLSSFNILGWGKSWPLFIIVAGVMTLAEKTAYQSVAVPPAYPVPPVTPAPPASATTIIPPAPHDDSSSQHDQEGR